MGSLLLFRRHSHLGSQQVVRVRSLLGSRRLSRVVVLRVSRVGLLFLAQLLFLLLLLRVLRAVSLRLSRHKNLLPPQQIVRFGLLRDNLRVLLVVSLRAIPRHIRVDSLHRSRVVSQVCSPRVCQVGSLPVSQRRTVRHRNQVVSRVGSLLRFLAVSPLGSPHNNLLRLRRFLQRIRVSPVVCLRLIRVVSLRAGQVVSLR